MTLMDLLLVIVTIFASTLAALPDLKLFAEWKELEFDFPTESQRQDAIDQGNYVRGIATPIDTDVFYGRGGQSKVFVTMPRFSTGIPITLGIINGKMSEYGPVIQAYPDYSWQSSHGLDCQGITSVFRISIDKCNRLWVVDTGRVGEVQHCLPQILIFNLNNDQLIHRYVFPDSQVYAKVTLPITPIVDVRDPPPCGTCGDTMAYIADVSGSTLMVYNMRKNTSWRIRNKLMYPHPPYGTFTIARESFDLMDGLFGLALSPAQSTNGPNNQGFVSGYHGSKGSYGSPQNPCPTSTPNRRLYFHSLASATENFVPLDIVDNSTLWENNMDAEPRQFVEIGFRGIQSGPQAMDGHGNLFFGIMEPIAIACWDSNTPYKRSNLRVIQENPTTLQFVSGLKIITNAIGEEELWAVSCRFQKVMTGTLTNREVNFRIQALKVSELIINNKCTRSGSPLSNFVS